jgi:hypothetical protein
VVVEFAGKSSNRLRAFLPARHITLARFQLSLPADVQ